MFSHGIARRRCLIPADGFYELRAVPGQAEKQPLRYRLADGGLFAFAGLFTGFRDRMDEHATCLIVTTAANALVQPVSSRMPAILDAAAEGRWLDRRQRDAARALALVWPYPAELMAVDLVSRRVSSPLVDGPELLVPDLPS